MKRLFASSRIYTFVALIGGALAAGHYGGFFTFDFFSPAKNEAKWLILDFDGTIADSWDLTLAAFADHAQRHGLAPIEPTTARHLTTKEILEKLGIGFFKQIRLVRDAKKYMASRIVTVPVFAEFTQVLTEIRKAYPIKIAIVSSNSPENIKIFLDKQALSFVDVVDSSSTLFGKGKALRSFMDTHGIKTQHVLYVGDEVRDIEGAHAAEVASLAVTWGFDSTEKLTAAKPTYTAQDAQTAAKVIRNFFESFVDYDSKNKQL